MPAKQDTQVPSLQHFSLRVHFDDESQTFWAEVQNMTVVVTGEAGLNENTRKAFVGTQTLFEVRAVQDEKRGVWIVSSANLSGWRCEVSNKEVIISTFFKSFHTTDDAEGKKKEQSIQEVRDKTLNLMAAMNGIQSIHLSIGKGISVQAGMYSACLA